MHVPSRPSAARHLALAAVVAALFAGCGESPTAAADCTGKNGNAAVAACHPDNQAIQDACPDNSGGETYAPPDDACLEAVRDSG